MAPPLIPKVGPKAGSRKSDHYILFNSLKASAKPTVTVDLPSPAGVGLIAVTKTTLPFLLLIELD